MILPETGFVRLQSIIGDPKSNPPVPAIIPVSKSTWWAGGNPGADRKQFSFIDCLRVMESEEVFYPVISSYKRLKMIKKRLADFCDPL